MFQNYLNFPKKFPLKLCNSLKLNILEIGLILCSVLPPESVDLPLLGNVYKQNLNLAVPLRAVPRFFKTFKDFLGHFLDVLGRF